MCFSGVSGLGQSVGEALSAIIEVVWIVCLEKPEELSLSAVICLIKGDACVFQREEIPMMWCC